MQCELTESPPEAISLEDGLEMEKLEAGRPSYKVEAGQGLQRGVLGSQLHVGEDMVMLPGWMVNQRRAGPASHAYLGSQHV
mgnify:CR=1 FL=1